MADKQFEQDDPFERVGVTLPRAMDEDAMAEMACCFVQELARMGYSREKLLRMFRDPFFTGPHAVYTAKGEGFVRALIDQIPDGYGKRERNAA